jgi:hypothetical protein
LEHSPNLDLRIDVPVCGKPVTNIFVFFKISCINQVLHYPIHPLEMMTQFLQTKMLILF